MTITNHQQILKFRIECIATLVNIQWVVSLKAKKKLDSFQCGITLCVRYWGREYSERNVWIDITDKERLSSKFTVRLFEKLLFIKGNDKITTQHFEPPKDISYSLLLSLPSVSCFSFFFPRLFSSKMQGRSLYPLVYQITLLLNIFIFWYEINRFRERKKSRLSCLRGCKICYAYEINISFLFLFFHFKILYYVQHSFNASAMVAGL